MSTHGKAALTRSTSAPQRPPRVATSGRNRPRKAAAPPPKSNGLTPGKLAAGRALRAYLDKAEAVIRPLQNEWGFAFKPSGEIVMDRGGKPTAEDSGEYGRIVPTWAELKALEGGTFTHNHPIGTSFSPADVYVAMKYNMAEMRAAGDGPYHYSVRPPKGGWSEQFWNTKVAPIIERIDGPITQHYIDLHNSGKMSGIDAERAVYHDIWTQVARETGLRYRRTRYRDNYQGWDWTKHSKV